MTCWVMIKQFSYQKWGVGYVGKFSSHGDQVSSRTLLSCCILDWHHTIDRVSPPDKLNTNPVQDLWNMFPRTHISIFIHPKQELDGFWGYITSKYWLFLVLINHFFGIVTYFWTQHNVSWWYNLVSSQIYVQYVCLGSLKRKCTKSICEKNGAHVITTYPYFRYLQLTPSEYGSDT